jgi:hypothetical protein
MYEASCRDRNLSDRTAISICRQTINLNFKFKYRHVYHTRSSKVRWILFVSPSFAAGEDNTPLLCITLFSTCVPKPNFKGMTLLSRSPDVVLSPNSRINTDLHFYANGMRRVYGGTIKPHSYFLILSYDLTVFGILCFTTGR